MNKTIIIPISVLLLTIIYLFFSASLALPLNSNAVSPAASGNVIVVSALGYSSGEMSISNIASENIIYEILPQNITLVYEPPALSPLIVASVVSEYETPDAENYAINGFEINDEKPQPAFVPESITSKKPDYPPPDKNILNEISSLTCNPNGGSCSCWGGCSTLECCSGTCEQYTCLDWGCTPGYPNACGGQCWRCVNPSDVFTCDPADGAVCCPSGYPYYCNIDNGCWNTPYRPNPCGSCPPGYPYQCNGGCYSCPSGGTLCCPSSGPPQWCCGSGSTCQSDGTCCSNDCSLGQTRCNGNAQQTCGNYDGDSCYEWGGDQNCIFGCAGGQCVNTATVYGYLKDEYNNPVTEGTALLAICETGPNVASDAADASGYFSMTTNAGNYEFHVSMPYGTVEYTLNGNTCNLYGGNVNLGNVQVQTRFTLSGYVQDEFGSPIVGDIVKLTDCSNNVVATTTTSSTGYFSVAARYGYYKLKVVHDGIEYIIEFGGQQCNYFSPGTYTLSSPIVFAQKTHLSGYIKDETGNPLQGLTAKFTDCSNNNIASDVTASDGSFELVANPGNYKLKVVTGFATFVILINGNECSYYPKGYGTLTNPIVIPMRTTIHGYFKDLNNNPINALPIELYTCSDAFETSATTNPSGYFSLSEDSGNHKIKVVIQGIRFTLVDQDGNSCFLFFGDIDIGTVNINPTIDCSGYENTCYNDNWHLYNCFFDPGIPGCVCYYEVCEFGCTNGQSYCNLGGQGIINIDVDNINDNYNPLAGAKIYLNNEFAGLTDALGKKSISAPFGYANIKVECPNGNFCASRQVWVDGEEYDYYDCACAVAQQKGNVQVNVNNPNGYPVANVYVFKDQNFDIQSGFTDAFGTAYIKNVPYGQHDITVGYFITNENYPGTFYKTQNINVDNPEEVLYITIGPPGSPYAGSNFSAIAGNYSGRIAPVIVAAAMEIIDIVSVTWDTEDWCRCVLDKDSDAFLGGLNSCVQAIQSCKNNLRSCLENIRQNAGKTSQDCALEEAMLVGDVASPFIPTGMFGHFAAFVNKELKFVDNFGRILSKTRDNIWTYTKSSYEWIAKWFTNALRKSIDIGIPLARLSDEAIAGAEIVAGKIPGDIGQRALKKTVTKLTEELGEEYLEKVFAGVKKLKDRNIAGAEDLASELGRFAKLYDETGNAGHLANFKGLAFEAVGAADSRWLNNVQEIRRNVWRPDGRKITDLDALLNNGDILEFKSGKPSISDLTDQIRNLNAAKQQENLRDIYIYFKNMPSQGVQELLQSKKLTGEIKDWGVL